MTSGDGWLPSSFRDPSGSLFWHEGTLYRHVNESYRQHYDTLLSNGLYQSLVDQNLLIPHAEVDADYFSTKSASPPVTNTNTAYKVLKPEQLAFISYPYEWSFSQLQAAALATLDIQLAALDQQMTLKDASAYNIQFHNGNALLIDTLSFEQYEDGQAWIAYRQFCQHFLAPLALAHYRDIRLLQLFRIHLDGVPLDLASRLLPKRSRARWSILTHIHLHAATQRHFADQSAPESDDVGSPVTDKPKRKIPQRSLIAMIMGLRRAVERLSWQPAGTEWADYYNNTNYSDSAFDAKRKFVDDVLSEADPSTVWDLGANDGTFSRLASAQQRHVVAFDIDPSAVEKNYLAVRANDDKFLLPLVLDLTNPSPAIGWACKERDSLADRGDVDCVMALALIHHLAISNNVPLNLIASYFAELGDALIIEFVPKSDSQVARLLATREDVFPNYHRDGFIHAFEQHFTTIRSFPVPQSEREIYFMRRR